MKITFGSIVFNILKTLPENMYELVIKNIHDIAHEIIIVEGATKATTHYWDGDTLSFTKDGHSTDGTWDYLQELKLKYPKMKLIRNENGFWNGKTEMSNAYASIATGDYMWYQDSDEFYHIDEMLMMIEILKKYKPDAVHFYANHFFGGFDYCLDERSTTWGNDIPWMRIFRNVPNKSYWLRHEPPLYVCDGLECNTGRIIPREETLKLGMKLYHYSFVSPSQITFKEKFFHHEYISQWNNFLNDKTIKINGSPVFKFEGKHPDIIVQNYIGNEKYKPHAI